MREKLSTKGISRQSFADENIQGQSAEVASDIQSPPPASWDRDGTRTTQGAYVLGETTLTELVPEGRSGLLLPNLAELNGRCEGALAHFRKGSLDGSEGRAKHGWQWERWWMEVEGEGKGKESASSTFGPPVTAPFDLRLVNPSACVGHSFCQVSCGMLCILLVYLVHPIG